MEAIRVALSMSARRRAGRKPYPHAGIGLGVTRRVESAAPSLDIAQASAKERVVA